MSTKTAPKNLADENFRKAYKQFLEKAKNDKKHKDPDWIHKSNCLYHDIYPICKQHFSEQEIAESKFKICQCGKFKDIKKKCDPQYRIGLNQVLNQTGYKLKKAHFEDLEMKINNQTFSIQLLQSMAGEIKKVTQPNTRKKFLGTASFHDKSVWFCYNKTFIEFRLKSRYTNEYIKIDKNAKLVRQDIANWWYQCWAVHGLREEKKENLKCRQYLSIHKNCFVPRSSLIKCCQRIVMYFYAENNERLDVEINGNVQQRLEEYEMKPRNGDKNVEREEEEGLQDDDEDIDINYNVDYSQNTTQSSQSQQSEGTLSIIDDCVMSVKHEETYHSDSYGARKGKKASYNELENKIARLENKCKRLEKATKELEQKNKDLSDRLYQATNGNNNGIELRSDSVVFTPPDACGYLSHPQQSQSRNDEQPPCKKQKLNNGTSKAINMQI